MKLDKALRTVTTYMEGSDEAEPVDFDNALKLLIEAGKHIKRDRELPHYPDHPLLPGETLD